MNKKWVPPLLLLSGLGQTAFAAESDDPLLFSLQFDELEIRDAEDNEPFAWDVQGWLGYDLDKFYFKTEGERADGETESSELQLLYSKAVAPFWDMQIGLRQDFSPGDSQSWVVFGVQGLAPYFFEVDTALFIGESGQTGLRLSAEYELLLTQKLILSPSLEVNLYGKNDQERGIGSGLSDLEAGLRLRYEIKREFAPYIGLNWEKKYGDTADFASEDGESSDDLQVVLGVKAWF
ncbi:copper resistance protein B [Motiliproteus sp. MSK22-1]|uniref:copper resistance protein B n=1 Tax=Motiliproteus sp. MSK22-1 TaxID=1897630 RepID=UPI0009781D6C|nr:copper resistance protein B [Motiliproteus sp. MSK22-1]OMH31784.1 copper resistance protein CopB [Motiliproteus sp. MSK22-1]